VSEKKGSVTQKGKKQRRTDESNGSAVHKAPTIRRWRLIIAAVFFFALIVQLILATLIRVWGLINPEDYAPMVVKLLTIYSAPFGVILGGILITRHTNPPNAGSNEVWVVLLLSCLWNALLLMRYLLITFKPVGDSIEQLAYFQDNVLPAGNFLISLALTYLYGGHKPE
jgi:hypothetical protein